MAFTARTGNVEMIDGRFSVTRPENSVSRSSGGMTVVAGGRIINPRPGGLTVHATFVYFDSLSVQYLMLLG